MTKQAFHLEASVDDRTGRIAAAYLRVREGSVAQTKEVKEGVAFADYDADCLLLGIELLGPCEVEVLQDLAEHETEPIKRFLRCAAPRELVVA
jgi:hypothetical protein